MGLVWFLSHFDTHRVQHGKASRGYDVFAEARLILSVDQYLPIHCLSKMFQMRITEKCLALLVFMYSRKDNLSFTPHLNLSSIPVYIESSICYLAFWDVISFRKENRHCNILRWIQATFEGFTFMSPAAGTCLQKGASGKEEHASSDLLARVVPGIFALLITCRKSIGCPSTHKWQISLEGVQRKTALGKR